ncbi:LysR family transcriptional regulator [Thalassotalea sp. LPB0316]|uniref:LysR family transcriptional regulator n=1 Tax=Thalassotalea sp. LPB0316 TaxID=2769490 RepID=UPI0018679568|nr:LysR family transcriptional regulator [Thalassotalea sp. LPB0316]QOL26171.1 LysR family transcriptional regulator [Thalassotalea sp. LPB0316]
MNNNKLFDGIIIFVNVVKADGFSAAAEILGHSTSHVSKAVNKLESRLGVRLLNRTTRSIGLTPEGKAYYQQCLQLIEQATVATNLITQHDIEPKGRLKISCPVQFAHQHLQPIINDYLSRYPNVSLDLNLSDRHLDVIAEGYDLVIRATEQLDESSLICRKIYRAKSHTIAAPEYLKRHGEIYHPRELTRHNCICYSNLKAPNRWDYTHNDGSQFNVEVKDKVLCNEGRMLRKMALAGHGVTRLPSFYIEQDLKAGRLIELFQDLPTPSIDVFAIYPSRKHLSPKVRVFIDMLTDGLGQ